MPFGYFWKILGSKIGSAARLASLPMGDLHLVHALGLEAPSQRLLDILSDRALDPAAPIFVPRWNRPPAPVVHGGNGAGHVNVGEANVGMANVGEANVGEANVGMAEDLQPPAAAPAVASEGPASDGVGSMVSAESSGVQGTKPDDPPAQPQESRKPWGPLLSWVFDDQEKLPSVSLSGAFPGSVWISSTEFSIEWEWKEANRFNTFASGFQFPLQNGRPCGPYECCFVLDMILQTTLGRGPHFVGWDLFPFYSHPRGCHPRLVFWNHFIRALFAIKQESQQS